MSRGQSHHLRAIHSLEFTIALDRKTVDVLDAFRLKRNAGVYDRAGAVSRAEADEMIALAQRLRPQVLDWLRRMHPTLVTSP